MKRFIRNKLKRWLGITKLYKEIREYLNDIRVLNHLISTLDTRIISLEKELNNKLKSIINNINRIDDKLVRNVDVDEDVSAEVQALKGDDKKWTREDIAYWEYMASYKEDNNDK